jgi:putative tryptophan/tyrosine transport system substrate-binding protein
VLTPNVGNPVFKREAEAAGRKLDLQTQFVEVGSAADFEAGLAELLQARVGAIYVAPSSMLLAHSAQVVQSVRKRGIPAVYNAPRYIEGGGLIAYGPSLKKNFVRATGHVDRILKGARPGDLPIEQITELELIVNMRAAKALGITIPHSILQRADRVIE